MQNEVRAPRAGRVAAIHVQPGATVAAGQTLATLE
jgi:biotin carboxyl carrier protein